MLKNRDIMLLIKAHVVKAMAFPVVVYGCETIKKDHKEGWVLKGLFFWTVVLENTLENPLASKEIKPVNPKGNQPWICIEKTSAEAEALIRWPPAEKKMTHWQWPWCWERLRVGGEGSNRGWDGCLAFTESMDVSRSNLWEIVKDREAWRAALHGMAKCLIQLSIRTTIEVYVYTHTCTIYIK